MSTWCILLSGGNGLRMGTQSNKTLISLLGEPALCRALRTLRRHADGVILVIRPQDEDEIHTALNDAQLTVDGVAYGGADRQESVRNGLSLLPEDCDIVLVHDGARPLVDDQTIENVLSSVRKYGSGVAATPVTDTIKRVEADDIVADTPPRGQLRAVQTPQGFSRALLCRAHAEENGEREHHNDRHRHNDAAAFFALLFALERGEQRLVPIPGLLRGGRYLLFIHTFGLL